MSRCEYDTIFQRVFCVTLVVIALTFTVILTNVFVDIDGILSSKEKSKSYDVPVPVLESEIRQVKVIRPDAIFKEERSFDEDNEENYRNKRSLETPNFLFHVKNPKMKSILTNRLATLLEELDAEETVPDITNKDVSPRFNDMSKTKEEFNKDGGKSDRNKMLHKRDEEDMLHLAMHNILLQGIIGHMDLNDVYKKVHALVKNFKEIEGKMVNKERATDSEKASDKDDSIIPKEHSYPKRLKDIKRTNKPSHEPSVEENKFFEEMVKCDELQNEITDSHKFKNMAQKEVKMIGKKGPKLLIKTIIDITSSNKDKQHKEITANSKESIKGIIKLIYNGKSVKFSRMDEDDHQPTKQNNDKIEEVTIKDIDYTPNEDIKDSDAEPTSTVRIKPERPRKSNAYFTKIIDDYFKKYPKKSEDVVDELFNEKIETKRLKRHIKIRYEDDEPTSVSPKPKRNERNDDNELFVEIETHFDSKGMKGDKKKKLIKSIIDKIQKAIHSDIDKFNDGNKKKHKHMQVKKRIQNPLAKDKKMLVNKIMLPFDTVEQRQSDPISKTVPLQSEMPAVADKVGESWKKSYFGPGFLTMSKSLNSAEMGEVNVDYNKIMTANGIPQRLQKPLNTDVSDEMLNANTYFDLGNLKFYIKNIDGTGLSIGFNQYTDEIPDPDTMKLFTGIEHLVKSYHQNDGTEGPLTIEDKQNAPISEERDHQISKRDIISNNNHVMIRRSFKETQEKDYHSNEYKIIYNNNFLPYKSYQEIYEDKKKRVALTINKETQNINTYDRGPDDVEIIRKNIEIKELPGLMDDSNNIFYKKLKPSEILGIASLLDRKKRSLNMHRIKNLNKKMKVNRYLNTHPMGRKKIFLNKKRSKRQIDKIRIIATESVGKPRHSDDNIFVVGDENLLADRAVIREVETPEVIDIDDKMTDHFGTLPLTYEDPSYVTHIFDGRSRHNQLMSKYPHIFMEEITKSKEDFEPILASSNYHAPNLERITEKKTTAVEFPVSKLDNYVDAIDPNQNYKLTVKILPKNLTGVNSGFKEIHASINKSFNRDGLRYSSLVNVSEISKIENMHNPTEKPTPRPTFTTPSTFIEHIKEQHNRMDLLLKQHKKRIDEQLDHLKRERLNLDTIVARTDEKNLTEKPETTTKANPLTMDDDVSKFLASALLKFQTQNEATTTDIPITSTPTTATTKLTTTTPKPTQDNLNSEILTQINKNTEMLRKFLQKLTGKLSKDPHQSEEAKTKYDFMPQYWKPFQDLPEIFHQPYLTKNDSHVPLPLIYAYQPLYHLKPEQHIPIASVVYHSHIHTDGKHIKPKVNESVKVEGKNVTKYFIDDVLVEELKVIPTKKDEVPSIVSVLPLNATAKV